MRLVIIFTILLFSLAATSQSSSNVQKTLITKRTATWCPNCGAWGWEFAKAIEELDNPNAILIRAHYSGDLKSDVAEDITENFNAVYQPEFYINENNEIVGSTTWPSKVGIFKEAIEANAEKSANFSFTVDGSHTMNSVSSSTSVTVLEDVEGDYYLATYLLEDNVVNNQSGLGAGAIHNSVIRRSLSGESFGNEIITGGASAGTSVSNAFEIESGGDDFSELSYKLLAVVWKKVNNQYEVANVHSHALALTSNISNTKEGSSQLIVSQHEGEVTYDFELSNSYSNGSITLMSMDGRILQTSTFDATSGKHLITKYLNNPIPNIVLVSISGNGSRIISKKILLR